MTTKSLIDIIMKHLEYRRCDAEWYISKDGLAVLKGELMAYEAMARPSTSQHEADQPQKDTNSPVTIHPSDEKIQIKGDAAIRKDVVSVDKTSTDEKHLNDVSASPALSDTLSCCPFCGEAGQVFVPKNGEVYWEVGCSECGSTFGYGFDTKIQAIYAWNKRYDKDTTSLSDNEEQLVAKIANHTIGGIGGHFDSARSIIKILRPHLNQKEQRSEISVNEDDLRDRIKDIIAPIFERYRVQESYQPYIGIDYAEEAFEAIKPFLKREAQPAITVPSSMGGSLLECTSAVLAMTWYIQNKENITGFANPEDYAIHNWKDFSVMALEAINFIGRETKRELVDQDTINLANNMESLLTAYDRSKAWEEERQKRLRQLREFLIKNYWPRDAVPQRAKHLLSEIEGHS